MMYLSESVAEQLFGLKPLFLAEVFTLLNKPDTYRFHPGIYRKIFQLTGMIGRNDAWVEIAAAFVAIVANRPSNSVFIDTFRNELDTGRFDVCESPAFPLGAVLGLFKAVKWLDENWRTRTPFENELPDVITRVVSRTTFLERGELVITPGYENQLSQAVKRYIPTPQEPHHDRGARLVDAHRIVEGVADIKLPEGSELPTLGGMVANNLAYGLFRRLSPLAQARAMADFYAKLLDEPIHRPS